MINGGLNNEVINFQKFLEKRKVIKKGEPYTHTAMGNGVTSFPASYNISNEDIPYNIHRIYSNFIYIHNLLYKQTIQYYHYLKGMIKTLNEELKNVNIRCSNIQLIASYPIEEREEEFMEPREG